MTPYSNRLSLKYPLFKNIRRSYWRSAASMFKISENYISRWFPKTELYQRSVSGARRLTSEVAGFDLCKFTESPSENSTISSPIHSSQPATYPLVLLGANCAQSNQRKETFNDVNELEFEFFDNISLFSHTTVSYAMDSTDIPRQTDSWLDEKRRVIDRECQNLKLGQTAILPDLPHKADTFPIENGDILVDIRNNHQMVYYNSVDAHIGAMDNVSVHGNGTSKDDTDLKALHENFNLPVMVNQGQQNQGNKILEIIEDMDVVNQIVNLERTKGKTYWSSDIKASEISFRIACCQQRFSNMLSGKDNLTPKDKSSSCMDYVGHDVDEKRVNDALDRSKPGPEQKRKKCKKKTKLPVTSTKSTVTKQILGCFVYFNLFMTSVAGEVTKCSRGTTGSAIQASSQGPNILLTCRINCDDDGCRDGVTKWDGGPNKIQLTFDSSSFYPETYQPVRQNQTYGLLIINPTNEMFNSTYICWQKFYCIDTYLPDHPVEPENLTVIPNYNDKTLIEVELNGIYPVPTIYANLGDHNVSSLVDIEAVKTGVLYICHVRLPNKQELCSYNDRLAMSYQLIGIQKEFFNSMVALHMCPSKTGISVGAVLGSVGGCVIALIVIAYCIKKQRVKGNFIPPDRSNKTELQGLTVRLEP